MSEDQVNVENREYGLGHRLFLGIDWGEKRIGLAMADSLLKIATPLQTVSNLNELLNIIKKEFIDEIVLGYPTKMSGRSQDDNSPFSIFLKKLKLNVDVPIYLIDERLSSLEADQRVGTKKSKASRDEIAAMIILQSFLDSKRLNKFSPFKGSTPKEGGVL